jgi:flavin-dependent dehydrogenase
MRTFLPNGTIKETKAPGYTIHRDRFDQALVGKARDAGARLLLGTRALCLQEKKVFLKMADGSFSALEAEVVLGADGPHSTVGTWIGAVNRHMVPAVQVRVLLSHPMEDTEVYFDKEIYGGYGWLFPKGDEANVGIGMKTVKGKRPIIRKVLNRFLVRLAKEGKIGREPLTMTAGWLPAEPLSKVVRGNVLLAGDAAGHTHPITGAGVAQAVICGKMAGKWAARAVVAEDLSLIERYDEDWRDHFGETLERAYERRLELERNWNHLDRVMKRGWVAFREYYGSKG